jgi:acylphosphatase
MGELVRLQATVRGRVQGVGFRHFTISRAGELGLVGYVKNNWNSTVEVVAEGDRESLEILLQHLHAGPRAATVNRVDSVWLPATGEFHVFGPRF